MIKRNALIGSSVALLLLIAVFSCSRKSTSVTDNPPPDGSERVDITADSDSYKEPLTEYLKKSGTHVTIGPEGNQTDSLFDFGYAPQGCHISHVFWLHNGYDDSLKIIKVLTG